MSTARSSRRRSHLRLSESDAITDGVAGPPARWDLILTFLALLTAIGIAVVYAQRARRRATGEPASSASA